MSLLSLGGLSRFLPGGFPGVCLSDVGRVIARETEAQRGQCAVAGARSCWLHVRLTPQDLAELDRARGRESRSSFARRLLAERSVPSWLSELRARRAAESPD